MNKIPTKEECIKLLKKEGCSDNVINHCKAVSNYAVKIAEKAGADVKLVMAGSLLHDIGRSKTHSIIHVLEGIKIAKKLGLSNEIVRIIERHIGAGITSAEAKKLGLPPNNYMPITLEEKIVCHADNLIQSGKKHSIEIEIKKAIRKGYKEYAIRLIDLHKELSEKCGMDLNKI